MADLSLIAASVLAIAGAAVDRSGIAGAAITAGQVVYQDAASGKWLLADNNGAAAARTPSGIALNGAANGQPLAVLKNGDVTIGAALTPGLAYYLSATPGSICPVGDLATGMVPTIVGIAKSATVLHFDPNSAGVAL